MSNNDKDALGMRRMAQYLSRAADLIESDQRRVFLVHVPIDGDADVVSFDDPKDLVAAVQALLALPNRGQAFIFFGEEWQLELLPNVRIMSSFGELQVTPPPPLPKRRGALSTVTQLVPDKPEPVGGELLTAASAVPPLAPPPEPDERDGDYGPSVAAGEADDEDD